MSKLIVNFKNYPEVRGDGSVRLAEAARKVSISSGVKIAVSPPTPLLALVASRVDVAVYSQSVGSSVGDKTTGAILPETVKDAKATGTILNHSESRVPLNQIRAMMPHLKALGLEVCLCARSSSEAGRLAKVATDFLAVEPPELIGTGIAVSRARPAVISKTVSAVRSAGFRGEVLCGAGIVSGEDVKKAVELGADGVLVSSAVVKAKDWERKLSELARSLK